MDDLSLEKQIRETGADFAARELLPHGDRLDDESPDIVAALLARAAENGVFGMTLPEDLGGAGFSTAGFTVFVEEVARGCAAAATLFAAHLAGIMPALLSPEQDRAQNLLRPVCEAEQQGRAHLFALAGDRHGDRVELSGRDGKHFLNGRAACVPGARVAACITAPAVRDQGGTVWVFVPADAPGVRLTPRPPGTGLKLCPLDDVDFDNVEITEENVLPISPRENGPAVCREACDPALASVALGPAREAYHIALKYSTERWQGGKMICEHEAVRGLMADMAQSILAMEGMIAAARGGLCAAFAAPAAEKICLDAIQVLGGYGYMKDYRVEGLLRDVKTLTSLVDPHTRRMEHIQARIKKL